MGVAYGDFTSDRQNLRLITEFLDAVATIIDDGFAIVMAKTERMKGGWCFSLLVRRGSTEPNVSYSGV